MAITHYIGVINQGVSNVNYAPTNYTNGCAVAAYVYPNEADTTKYDCVLYADVETIYAQAGKYLFYNLESVENITFDCKFSMANATDKSMYRMFNQDYNLVQINGLENFDTSNVTDMECMFVHCRSLTTIDVSHFDTSKVTNMRSVFSSCEKITSIKGLEKWNTSNVTNMFMMFANCYELKELDVSSFDTSKVTNMGIMFQTCEKLTVINGLENFNTANVTNMDSMFANCYKLTTIDVSHFDTSKVTNMEQMFGSCFSLTTLDVSHFDTTNVTDMARMFYGCTGLTELDVSGFNTSNVTKMSWMFDSCASLTSIDVSNFDTSNVTDMRFMFNRCNNLTIVKGLENFNTSQVTNRQAMFAYCYGMEKLDLSNFDLSSITDVAKLHNFMYGMTLLKEVKVPKNMNGCTIQLPSNFGMSEVDSSMAGWTLLQGSKEFNILYNNLMNLKTCDDYMQSPELQAMYDGLSNEEKEKFATLTDNDGVILADKLAYMVYLADYHSNTDTAATHMAISPRTSQYLVIVIACLSLALIGGYYFIQKKKYAK